MFIMIKAVKARFLFLSSKQYFFKLLNVFKKFKLKKFLLKLKSGWAKWISKWRGHRTLKSIKHFLSSRHSRMAKTVHFDLGDSFLIISYAKNWERGACTTCLSPPVSLAMMMWDYKSCLSEKCILLCSQLLLILREKDIFWYIYHRKIAVTFSLIATYFLTFWKVCLWFMFLIFNF